MAPSGTAVTTAPADQVALAAHQIANRYIGDSRADLDDFARELMAHGHRRLESLLRPFVPRLDMQIGAANARCRDLDQHITCLDAGTGTSINSSPGPGWVFTRAFTTYLPHRHTATP